MGLRCPGCGYRIAVADRFCEECGRELAVRRAVLPEVEGGSGDGCAECGGMEFDGDGYCAGCGELRRPPDRGEADLGAVQLITDRGIAHARNEDAVAAAVLEDAAGPAIVIAVCDGVSTSENPQVASNVAARTGVAACLAALAADRTASEAVGTGLEAASQAVRAVGIADGHAPSCTYVSAVLRSNDTGESEITVVNIGDSRAYWLAADKSATPSRRLTVDDSWAQALVDAGAMDEEAAMRDPRAHALIRWLGADSDHRAADTRVTSVRVRGPGVLLLCSDGLWNYLSAADDLAALATAAEPRSAARDLVEYALRGGGSDNITVALAPVMPQQ
ncbi:protein phosphatase 2C domain-containing protein [Nocardia terpenica]|nr:protein phosphatase 2C domain-containing protein [Nocardia terpenica]MBF6104239.1 protein phosphatase 2C domain-containing protein [Nocardia terpenica]MBF6109905.1 protein phosphatase 2C domain-containing protein [Nocardia terpenica]MBF6120211.1 protein phosphatase 2C domain-containing protein [Nocardia terpenica]MBF6152622.1 protein phosphatase 2C domain-containing protein [Nocardia terpenica]